MVDSAVHPVAADLVENSVATLSASSNLVVVVPTDLLVRLFGYRLWIPFARRGVTSPLTVVLPRWSILNQTRMFELLNEARKTWRHPNFLHCLLPFSQPFDLQTGVIYFLTCSLEEDCTGNLQRYHQSPASVGRTTAVITYKLDG